MGKGKARMSQAPLQGPSTTITLPLCHTTHNNHTEQRKPDDKEEGNGKPAGALGPSTQRLGLRKLAPRRTQAGPPSLCLPCR